MQNRQSRFPLFLLIAYVLLFGYCAIAPYDRAVWWAENIPIVMIVVFLVATYRRFTFSNPAYAMMSVLIFMHTIGGYYTFERVPFGWVTNLFGFERNHYDRIGHFSVGFYAFAICEYFEAKGLTNRKWVTALFAIFSIFAVAALYEIVEWLYAVSSDPKAGAAFLGSQGDVWDAQKDMLADGLGGILATALFYMLSITKRHK